MKNLIYLVLGVITLLTLPACNSKHGKNYNNETLVDADGLSFVRNAAEGGLTEIKASGLALTKTSNQRVLALAKMMIDDHTKAGMELKKIETSKLVVGNDTINAEHRKLIGELTSKTGRAFDKAYIDMMVNDHEQAAKLFAGASRNNAVAIKDFATKTFPVIQMHLDSAKAVQASLK
jgi:putative membrane protein